MIELALKRAFEWCIDYKNSKFDFSEGFVFRNLEAPMAWEHGVGPDSGQPSRQMGLLPCNSAIMLLHINHNPEAVFAHVECASYRVQTASVSCEWCDKA